MSERPILDKNLDSKTFRDYYYLKEELLDFCRKNGLPVSGGKIELTERIAYFLDTGKIKPAKTSKKKSNATINITENSKIEPNFVCSENHRAFFKEHIGSSFSFNVAFQKWLKSNTGKTYKEAISAYYEILENKKQGKTKIDRQFEYNTYIKAFFSQTEGLMLSDAIKCWKYKKTITLHPIFEVDDLKVLEND